MEGRRGEGGIAAQADMSWFAEPFALADHELSPLGVRTQRCGEAFESHGLCSGAGLPQDGRQEPDWNEALLVQDQRGREMQTLWLPPGISPRKVEEDIFFNSLQSPAPRGGCHAALQGSPLSQAAILLSPTTSMHHLLSPMILSPGGEVSGEQTVFPSAGHISGSDGQTLLSPMPAFSSATTSQATSAIISTPGSMMLSPLVSQLFR